MTTAASRDGLRQRAIAALRRGAKTYSEPAS